MLNTAEHLLTSAWFTLRPVLFAVAGGDKKGFRSVSELLNRWTSAPVSKVLSATGPPLLAPPAAGAGRSVWSPRSVWYLATAPTRCRFRRRSTKGEKQK